MDDACSSVQLTAEAGGQRSRLGRVGRELTCELMQILNENQNGSVNEEVSNKGALKINARVVFLGSFALAGDFRNPNICSQEHKSYSSIIFSLYNEVILSFSSMSDNFI